MLCVELGIKNELKMSLLSGTCLDLRERKKMLEMDGGDGCTAVLIYIILLNCTLKNYENATMRHPLIPVKMAITKKSPNNKCWRGYGGRGTLLYC